MYGQKADAGSPDKGEEDGGDEHGPRQLGGKEPEPIQKAPELVRRPGAVHKHEPPHEAVLRLRDEANRTHGAFPQIPVDEQELDVPGDDALDKDGDSRIPGKGVWKHEQPDGLPHRILVGVHAYG